MLEDDHGEALHGSGPPESDSQARGVRGKTEDVEALPAFSPSGRRALLRGGVDGLQPIQTPIRVVQHLLVIAEEGGCEVPDLVSLACAQNTIEVSLTWALVGLS